MPERKGVIWTEQDVDQQREINRQVEGISRGFNPIGESGLWMPVHVVPLADIEPGQSGTCEFLAGGLGAPFRSGRTATMWNRVNEGTLGEGEECLAVRVMQPTSGGAGWSLVRTGGGRAGTPPSGSCGNYTTDTFQGTSAARVELASVGIGSFRTVKVTNVPSAIRGSHRLVHDGSIELPSALGSWNACKYVKFFDITFQTSEEFDLVPRLVPGGRWWLMLEFKFSTPNYFQDLTIHSEKWNSTAVLRTDNAGSAPDMSNAGSLIEFTSLQSSPRPPHFSYTDGLARGLIVISPPLTS